MSPIKGMTDRGEGFACIGDIRKGAPKGEKRPGKDLEYFRVEFYEGEEEAAAKFVKVYGQEPKALDILLPFNEIERCWDAWYEAYKSGGMLARADGEKYIYFRDGDTGEILVHDGIDKETGGVKPFDRNDVVATWLSKKGKTEKEVPVKLAPVGRLKVILPVLGRLAFLTLHTTSVHDIVNISEQLEGLRKIHDGELRGIPIVMKRVPKMISTPGEGGKRVRREKSLISLEADPSWVREKLLQIKQAALPGNGLVLLPRRGFAEDEVVEGEIVQEGETPNPEGPVIRFTSEMYAWVVKEGLAPDLAAAEGWLERSNLPVTNDKELVRRWLMAFERGLDLNDGREDLAATTANKTFEKLMDK